MILIQQISSGTVIALSMGELLSMLVVLVSIIGGIIAFVRKDEKDNGRIAQIERQHADLQVQVGKIADLQVQVAKLTEQIQLMLLQSNNRPRKTNGNTS